MSEIKVGEYVRTKKGKIEKIETINKFCIVTIDKDNNYTNSEEENYYTATGSEINKGNISKHSPNIIDLIEVRRLCEWI